MYCWRKRKKRAPACVAMPLLRTVSLTHFSAPLAARATYRDTRHALRWVPKSRARAYVCFGCHMDPCLTHTHRRSGLSLPCRHRCIFLRSSRPRRPGTATRPCCRSRRMAGPLHALLLSLHSLHARLVPVRPWPPPPPLPLPLSLPVALSLSAWPHRCSHRCAARSCLTVRTCRLQARSALLSSHTCPALFRRPLRRPLSLDRTRRCQPGPCSARATAWILTE